MHREQLEHLLRAAGELINDDVIVIGSQAILGSFTFDELPARATLSVEADFIPVTDVDGSKADTIDGIIGEYSPFHDLHEIYAQGVGRETAVLPEGWQSRLRKLQNSNTNGTTGYCLDPYDLVLSKLVAGREKDFEFAEALVASGLLDIEVLEKRIELFDLAPALIARVREAVGRMGSSS